MDKKHIKVDSGLLHDIAMHELNRVVDAVANYNPAERVRQQQESKRIRRMKARDFLSRVYGDRDAA